MANNSRKSIKQCVRPYAFTVFYLQKSQHWQRDLSSQAFKRQPKSLPTEQSNMHQELLK